MAQATNRLRTILLLLALAMGSWHVSASELDSAGEMDVSSRQDSDDGKKGPLPGRCKVELVFENPKSAIDSVFHLSIITRNVGDKPLTVLSLDFNSLVRFKTVELLTFDSDGNCVGNLLQARGISGSAQSPAESHWRTLRPGEAVEAKIRARARVMLLGEQLLKPGKYQAQLVVLDRYLSEYPYAGIPNPAISGDERYLERLEKWREKYPGKEMFRSNSVEIELE